MDACGHWLDRREFHETKEVLTTLSFNQTGWYRNHIKRYQGEAARVVPSVTRRGLSEDHGIQLRVRSDGQAWFAWRCTPGGYHFGVGGTVGGDAHWQYDGQQPPTCYPGKSHRGWRDTLLEDRSPEWTYNDGPIPDA